MDKIVYIKLQNITYIYNYVNFLQIFYSSLLNSNHIFILIFFLRFKKCYCIKFFNYILIYIIDIKLFNCVFYIIVFFLICFQLFQIQKFLNLVTNILFLIFHCV